MKLFNLHLFVNYRYNYCWLFILLIYQCLTLLADARSKLAHYQTILCADLQCQEPISDGLTTTKYPSPEEIFLSFKQNSNVKIFGKTSDNHFYFAEINKKRGFVPAKLIKETKVHLENAKLSNVQFDFEGLKRTLSIKINSVDNHSNDSVVLSSSDQRVDDIQSNTATPFVYSQKVTVIDGTTIDEDLLQTATPSPTFAENSVTKTATIQANFSDVEFDKTTVSQKLGELSKEHGSLYKLAKPIDNDVIVESEDSSEQIEDVIITSEPTNIENVSADNAEKMDKRENVSPENTHTDDDTNVDTSPIDENEKQTEENPESIQNEEEKVEMSTSVDNTEENSLVNESDEPSSMDSTITDNKIELLNDEETIQADLTSNDTTHSGSMTNFPNPSADTTMNVDSSTKNTDNLPNDSSSLSASNNNAADDQQLNESKLNTEDNNQLPNSLVNDNSNKEQVKQEQNQPSFSANEVPVSDSINAQNQYPHQQSLHHQNPARHHQQQQVYYQQQPGQYHQQQPVQYQQPQQPVQYQQPQQSGQYQQPQQPVQYQQPQQPVQYQQPQQPVQYQHQQQHVHYHHQQQPGQYQQPLQYQQQPVQHQPQTVQHPPQPVQYQQQPVQHQQQRIQHPPPQIQNPSQQAQHPQQQIQHPPPKVQSTTQPTQQPVQHPHIRNRRTNYEINNPNIGLNINQGNPNQPLNSENQQQIPGQNQQPSIDTKSQESTQQHAHPVNQPLHQHEPSINSRLKRDNLHSEINQSDNITTNDDNINSDNNIDKPENILLPPTINSEQNNKNLPDLLSHHSLLNNNVIKRKFLAERVGIVSVIMDIIPDEVELFFESFNISLHAIIFTSIVAFFWCLMKMIIFFISSSKMSRELRGTICETQRKLYYVEAENDKLKEECSTFRNESTGFRSNLNKIEKRKYQLEQENEKIKNEITSLRKENSTLKLLNESNDKSSTLLDSLRTELDEYKQESLDANVKINELQNQIDLHLSTIKELKEKSSADKEKIQNLNEELEGLNDKVEKSNKLADEAEQKFRILHLDNVDLKEQQSQLNMEMKEIKDELLSSQEKIQNFTDENNTLKENAINLEEKIASLSLSLENKEAEITSMQTLLKKLNKNKNNDHDRKRRSVMGDENGIINDDDLNDDETLDTMENDKLNENVQDETDSLMDVVQLQVCLAKLESEKKQLEQKYNDLLKQKNDMEHDIEGMKKLNEKLKSEAEDALNEKTKAMIKLEVLTEHYNAKELDYAKDLGVFKVKQEQQNVDVESLNTKLGMLQDENIGLKDHVKRIQKEMEDSERYYKGQLRNLEKQSHENWFAAKSAEQKYEQSKAEASVLRQMFSQSMKSPPPSEHFGNFDDSASSVSSIPDMLNSSLIVPPPPPIPPFIFPSMFGQQSIPNNQPTQTLPAPSVPAIQFYDTNGSNASSQAYSTNQTYNTNPNSSYNTNSIYNSPSTYTSPPAYNTDSTYNTNPTYNSNQSYSSNNTSGYWNSPPTPAAPAAVSSSTAQTPITNINYSYNTATPNNMIISTTATNISSNVSNMNYSQPNLNTNSMHTNTMQYSTDTGGNHHRPHSTSSNNYVDVYFGP